MSTSNNTSLINNTPSISGFNSPRKFKQELINFFQGVKFLEKLISPMEKFRQGISSQAIMTALMVDYVYNHGDNASLIYFSTRNIKSIQVYLANNLPDMSLLNINEGDIINNFIGCKRPESYSNDTVESALRKVGITRSTTDASGKRRVINSQYIGADVYMLERLPKSFEELERLSSTKAQEAKSEGNLNWENRLRCKTDFRFADMQRLVSINFVAGTGLRMTKTDEEMYIKHVLPVYRSYRDYYIEAKKAVEITTFEKALNQHDQFSELLNDKRFAELSDNFKLRLLFDDDLQRVQLDCLRCKLNK